MKLHFLALILLLPSCDHIDAVGDKVNELKDMRQDTTRGVDGMKLDQIVSGTVAGPSVQDLSEIEFQAFISQPGRLNIVDFHADWCPPCRKLGPILSDVVSSNANVARLGKINVDGAKELSKNQGVSSIPDVRFYVNGALVDRFVGGRSEQALKDLIAKHSASLTPDYAAQLNDGIDGTTQDTASVTAPPRPSNAKPLEEAMQPMKENWLPPGMSQKK